MSVNSPTDSDEALRDQFSLNIRNQKAKERLFLEVQSNHRSLPSDKAISIAKVHESLQRSEENDYTFEKNDEMEIDKVSNHGKNIKNCSFVVNLTDTENGQHLEKHVPNAQKRIILQLFVRQRMRSRNSRKKKSF